MREIFEIVYLVKCENIKTQRDLADRMFVSLGKINNLMSEAIAQNFINNDQGYVVTEKGEAFLEEHKVDNAIIMAAGFGSRFVPMTYETPKGLLIVNGEVMIERQIRQLQEVGINDISIVVGYLKETFEYLTEKFGVKLIYNPDYSIKNNISSIYYTSNSLKNTYILPSDIYMPENIFRKYEYDSFYAVEYFEEETTEWAIKMNKDNQIIDVNPSGGKNTWAMYGPAFFTRKFSEELLVKVVEIYDNKISSQWYWEDIYIRNMQNLKMYGRKYTEGSILEFESLEELRQYDPSYLIYARSEILEVIEAAFNVELDEIVGIKTLKEGMTNDSFLFDVRGNRYVFRNPGIGTEKLINRTQEAQVYEVIKSLNLSDEIMYLDPIKGYKITKYLPNSRTIDIYNEKEVEMALEKLRVLHRSGLSVGHEFDLEERIDYYINLARDSKAIFFTDFESVYEMIIEVIKYTKNQKRMKKLCHIDPVCDNFLLSEGNVLLLDWEYAAMADPLLDIAMYVVYSGLQDNEILDLLRKYLQRDYTAEEKNIVFSYVSLAGFLWSIWTIYKQASGEDFGTYGIEQYQYARKYATIVLKEVNHA